MATVNRSKAVEQRLRARIRRSLGADRAGSTNALENEVLRLIKRYGSAPENLKEKVYREGEERLMKHIRSRTKAA
jgi:hypothetical protein